MQQNHSPLLFTDYRHNLYQLQHQINPMKAGILRRGAFRRRLDFKFRLWEDVLKLTFKEAFFYRLFNAFKNRLREEV